MPVFKSPLGTRPVVLDVLGPDWVTSVLPDDMKMVLHVNPKTMNVKYQRQVERIQTWGGWVEQHWGDAMTDIDFDMASGGFMRLYSGLSNTTNPAYGGTRRQTIAYDKFQDMLALYMNNGSIYDTAGHIALQGIIKLTFEEGIYLGWLNNFTVSESADTPYQFSMSAAFTVHREEVVWKTALQNTGSSTTMYVPVQPTTQEYYQPDLFENVG